MGRWYLFSFSLLAVGALLTKWHPWLALATVWCGAIQLLNLRADRLKFPRIVQWLYAMTVEVPAVLIIFFSRFFPMRLRPKGSGVPILLVHGYINHARVWFLQKRWLEAMGLGPIYTIGLGHPFRSIEEYAEKVKRRAEEIARKTHREDLVLVGHSMGGLVCSWYATHLAKANTIKHVITIGSPLQGTPMAYIAIGQNGRQMEPHSLFTHQLRESMQARPDIPFSHIATTSDQIVWPASSAFLSNHNHKILHDVGHAGLLYSHRVAHQINQWLHHS